MRIKPLLRKISLIIQKKPLASLLLFGITLRTLVIIFYSGATIYPDSKVYVELGELLFNFNLNGYNGQRTPGFPLLIAVSGGNLLFTVIIQQIIGLLNIFLIYDFSYKKTKSKITSFWIALITSSFLHVIFYEIAILTETLSLFLVLLSFWIIVRYNILDTKAPAKYYVLLSLVLSWLYLTRPFFIYFPIVFVLFVIIKNFNTRSIKNIYKPIIIIIFPLISYYSWCSLNEKNIGYFSSTYFLGINLAQTATSFFEKAPDDKKLIRDIFVKHRKFVVENKHEGEYPMTVWYAYDELIEKTQLSPPDLSNELGEISKDLFKKYPHLYLKQVFISLKDFWGANSTFVINKEQFTHIVPKYLVYGVWKIIQRYILILMNILFILFSIKKTYKFIISKFKTFDLDLLIVIIVIGGSVAQALVAYGNNSRFCFPYLPLIVYFVITNLFSLKTISIANAKNTTA